MPARLADDLANYVVLHIGRGERHRDWPALAWIELGRRLIGDGLHLVYTGESSEAPHSESVRAALRGENLIGRLSLRGFATIISRARGLISIDTVAGHLAACFRVPTAIIQNGVAPLTPLATKSAVCKTCDVPGALRSLQSNARVHIHELHSFDVSGDGSCRLLRSNGGEGRGILKH